jgi:hypothetical protein
LPRAEILEQLQQEQEQLEEEEEERNIACGLSLIKEIDDLKDKGYTYLIEIKQWQKKENWDLQETDKELLQPLLQLISSLCYCSTLIYKHLDPNCMFNFHFSNLKDNVKKFTNNMLQYGEKIKAWKVKIQMIKVVKEDNLKTIPSIVEEGQDASIQNEHAGQQPLLTQEAVEQIKLAVTNKPAGQQPLLTQEAVEEIKLAVTKEPAGQQPLLTQEAV